MLKLEKSGFSQHNLPVRFVRIRHYGILRDYKRKERLKAILEKLGIPKHPKKLNVPTNIQNLLRFGSLQITCPKCSKGKLVLSQVVLPNPRDDPYEVIVNQDFIVNI